MSLNQWNSLAQTIVFHSLELKKGEHVLIDVSGQADELIQELVEQIFRIGAVPHIRTISIKQLKRLMNQCPIELVSAWAKKELEKFTGIDAYIGIRADDNVYEFNDVPLEKYEKFKKSYFQRQQLKMAMLDKWVLLNKPTYGLAQLANISLDEFTNVFFQATSLDYSKLADAVKPLSELLLQTDKVRIVSPETDLTFSIKGIKNFVCNGKYNLPDGEIFTAPVVSSVNGYIRFNLPSSFLGQIYDEIELRFQDGKVIEASCNKPEELWSILRTDEGSSRIGEFGIGFNPYITKPYNNLLFDEKMFGSIHLALGQAFEMADNGNKSSIHWDLVLCQLPEYGGGELFFDDLLVRKDGLFQGELQHLNHILV